jgi:hypothetical protein
MAKIDADRIETVAQRPRHAEQSYGAAGDIDSRVRQMPFRLNAKRCRTAIAMVGLVQGEQVEAIMG